MKSITMQGLSIVEFLIAITLGALLISGVISIYVSNKTTYTIQEGLARLQENGRYVNHIFTSSIRMAGFQGCANQNQVTLTNLVTNPSNTLDFDKAIYGYQASGSSWSPSLPTLLINKVKPGTDVIEIRLASNSGVQLRADMNQANNPILVYDRLGINAGDIIIISDCNVGDIIVAGANSNATAITHTVANNESNYLTKAYQTDAQVMRYEYYAFYIKNTGRTNNSNAPIFGLYRMDINGNEIEIAEGVEDLQITYGIDTNGDNTADSYLTASTINTNNQWPNVIAVNATKLLNTINDVGPTSQNYRFNNTSFTATDRRLRREWPNFITLRNRGL